MRITIIKKNYDKTGDISKEVRNEIKDMSKEICDEIRTMSSNECKAIIEHAKPRKFDKWVAAITVILSLISIVCSIRAIRVAIDIPSQIATEQNKIALYEKRYEVYCEIRTIKEFVDKYFTSGTSDSVMVAGEYEYVSLWEEEIHINLYPSIENAGTVMKIQEQKIRSIDFIFENITDEERILVKDFFDIYYSLTQRFVKGADEEAITIFLNDSAKISVMNEISELMDKMEQQLSLSE